MSVAVTIPTRLASQKSTGSVPAPMARTAAPSCKLPRSARARASMPRSHCLRSERALGAGLPSISPTAAQSCGSAKSATSQSLTYWRVQGTLKCRMDSGLPCGTDVLGQDPLLGDHDGERAVAMHRQLHPPVAAQGLEGLQAPGRRDEDVVGYGSGPYPGVDDRVTDDVRRRDECLLAGLEGRPVGEPVIGEGVLHVVPGQRLVEGGAVGGGP